MRRLSWYEGIAALFLLRDIDCSVWWWDGGARSVAEVVVTEAEPGPPRGCVQRVVQPQVMGMH